MTSGVIRDAGAPEKASPVSIGRPPWWLMAVALVVGSLVTADVLNRGWLERMDLRVSDVISSWELRDSAAFPVIWVVTQVGGRVAILVVLAVLVGYLGWRRHTWLPLVRVLIALGLLTVVVYGIKHGTGRTAPGFPGAYFFHADGESFPSGHVANAVLMWGIARWQAVEYGLPLRVQRAFWALSIFGPARHGPRHGLAGLPLDHRRRGRRLRRHSAAGRGARTGRNGSVTLGTCPSRPADRVAARGGDWRRRGSPRSRPRPRLPPARVRGGGRPGARSARSPTPGSPELSGLVVVDDQLVAINDGGDQVTVFLLDAACQVADVHTAAVDPYDPEDLAVAADGTVWLADAGDNDAIRTTVALIALRPDGSTSVFRLTYPDGPHDAEALLLAPDGTPYLVTKEILGRERRVPPGRPHWWTAGPSRWPRWPRST